MSEKLIKKMNDQFNNELASGYDYLAMSAYVKDMELEGCANFFFQQAKEEFEHAMKFYNFLFDIDHKVKYQAMEEPKEEYGTILDVFKAALEHEKYITKCIRELYEMAEEEKNYEVIEFLGWFIKEQVEEEDSFRSLITKFERANESWSGIYLLDSLLAKRG